MLPINPIVSNYVLDKDLNMKIPIYSFQDPNSVDFQYNFNALQTPYNGTVSGPSVTQPSGVGYFGSNFIASPQFICHPFNSGNAFSENFPNWLSTINGQIDLRAFYVSCKTSANGVHYY